MADGVIYTKGSGVYVPDEDGDGFRVDGSKHVNRDISKSFNWWGVKRRNGELPKVPAGKNWCACHEHEGYDEQGMDDGGWRPVSEFTEFTDVRGKRRLHEHCNTCRARHKRRMYALMKEAAGEPVRTYKRQLVAMQEGG